MKRGTIRKYTLVVLYTTHSLVVPDFKAILFPFSSFKSSTKWEFASAWLGFHVSFLNCQENAMFFCLLLNMTHGSFHGS